jgi:hypothetical protein
MKLPVQYRNLHFLNNNFNFRLLERLRISWERSFESTKAINQSMTKCYAEVHNLDVLILCWCATCRYFNLMLRCNIYMFEFNLLPNPPTEYKQFIMSQLITSKQKINKNLRFSVVILCWNIYRLRWEKSLAVREIVQDTYRARNETANPILFKF